MCSSKPWYAVLVVLNGLILAGCVTLGVFAEKNLHLVCGAGVLFIFHLIYLLSLCSHSPHFAFLAVVLNTVQLIALCAVEAFLVYCIIVVPTFWKQYLSKYFLQLVRNITGRPKDQLNHRNLSVVLGAVGLAAVALSLLTLILGVALFHRNRRRLRRTLPIQAEFGVQPYTTLDVEGPKSVRLYNVKL